MASFELVEPQTLEETFAALDSDDPAVRPYSGGTALMLMMKAQIFKPVRLVSLRGLGAPFHGLSSDGKEFRIGAMTTFSQLEKSPEIKSQLPIVYNAMEALANVRVRNVATVGGNLAHADPHLDLPPIWTALDAVVHIVGRGGARTIPVEKLFAGYYETTLAQGEIISEIRVPVRPDWKAHYAKVTTRAQHDWPALGIAVAASVKNGTIADARVVVSAGLDRPTRLTATEAVLRGATWSDRIKKAAGEAAVSETQLATDNRGTAAYKRHLLQVHVGRAITTIIEG